MHEALLDLVSLEGRSACVTGAGRGIGRAVAERLAQAGAWVMLTDIDEGLAREAAASILGQGGVARYTVADASRVGDAARVIEQTFDSFGRIDILVNNAAVFLPASVVDVTEAEWDRIVDIHFKGVFFHAQAAAKRMIASRVRGRIINIASQSHVVPAVTGSTYSAAKGGVVALTRALARELGAYGITVNSVSPGTIITPGSEETRAKMRALGGAYPTVGTPPRSVLGRTGAPEEIANAVFFLASDLASYVTGITMPVDGGYAIM